VKMTRDMFRVQEAVSKLESIEIPAHGLEWFNVKLKAKGLKLAA